MFSARLDPNDAEYIRDAAYDGRKSNQDILSEAIALHRQANQVAAAK